MNSQAQLAPTCADELAGDLTPLVEHLGSPEGAASLGAVAALLQCPRIADAPSLGRFLDGYCAQLLVPVELPAIYQAWRHASRFEARELIALDQRLGCEPLLKSCALASLHAGRNQLRRLRPLRDQKLVQRYLKAIDNGEAGGWHTLVYGLTLAIYSLPPRQGLIAYARQTLAAFAHSAGRHMNVAEASLSSLVDGVCGALPKVVNGLVDAEPNRFCAPAAERTLSA